ncbi:hypothetical protein HELRODRAFT_168818 [Helobdella robusta]|uniref:Uncharacterized protein n=1 Tax=Helobdella robusta TaxID=6412 RepID=T1F103_HELRO|nr:hypothetical protein HELRODRAFT_168818 [Helobdella robusta]ESO08899.1 hypothetical protein HELRODRAFT_168818 [Helobdella robusta]
MTAASGPVRATDVLASDESTSSHSGASSTKTFIQRSASSDAIVLMDSLQGGASHTLGKSVFTVNRLPPKPKPMQASSSNLRRHLTPNLPFSIATNYHKMLESSASEQRYPSFSKWLQGSTEYLNQELEKLALANEMAEKEKLSSIPDGHRAPIDELLLMFCDSPNNSNNNDFIEGSDGVARHKKIAINDINVISDSNNNNLSTDDENNNNTETCSSAGKKEVMIKSITNVISVCRDINDNTTPSNNNNIDFAVADITTTSQRQQLANNTLDNTKPPLIIAKLPLQQQQQSQHQQQSQSQHQQQNVPSIPSNQSAFVTLPRSFKVKQLGEVTMATT